ncbi:MAG TPA: hypothetical protein VK822_29120, partial [Acetobacteraceae bacterium]|nr:hypothetical protein [Acetobacteraceae bacterium]
PDVNLFPLPVGSDGGNGAVEKGVSLRLEAAEYTKYLLTASGLSALLPRREPDALGTPVSAGG